MTGAAAQLTWARPPLRPTLSLGSSQLTSAGRERVSRYCGLRWNSPWLGDPAAVPAARLHPPLSSCRRSPAASCGRGATPSGALLLLTRSSKPSSLAGSKVEAVST